VIGAANTQDGAQATIASAYERDGFVVLRGVFDPAECRAISRECWRLLSLPLVEPDNHRTPFRKGAPASLGVPERFDPVLDVSPMLRDLAADRRIMEPLRAIYGVGREGPAAFPFKDKIIFKAPGVEGYVLHQDASWWQGMGIPTERFLSVSISIDAATAENGCLQVIPGVHDRLVSTPGEIRNLTPDEAEAAGWPEPQLVQTEPGDVVMFHGLTPHCSGTNTTSLFRRSFYLTYNHPAEGDRRDAFYEKDIAMKTQRAKLDQPGIYFE
jgi:hypothetical protein